MRCPECDFLYNELSASDRRFHRKVHNEVLNGLERSILADCSVVTKSGTRAVVVVNGSSPRSQRRVAQELSLVGARETDLMGLAYHADEKLDERNLQFFIGVEGRWGRAYIIVERRFRVWFCSWPEYEAGTARSQAIDAMWSVGYAWVGRGHRRQGWGRMLVEAASASLKCPGGLAWYTPFSDGGEALVRALCPNGIFIAK